jgi:aryl-alcohol dehydrogenase-like predicted oxidoreductase
MESLSMEYIQRRERAIIATKVGLDRESGKILQNSSPVRLRQELEDLLCRLHTDVIDIYQVHWPDESVPFEETAKTLDTFKCEGKIRAIGVSNFSPHTNGPFLKGWTVRRHSTALQFVRA